MGLTVTATDESTSPGGTIVVTVVRDSTPETVETDYAITFNEVASGAVIDTGDITLTVVAPVGATSIQPVDESGLLTIVEDSDDGTTAVFSVTFPTGDAAPAADPPGTPAVLGADAPPADTGPGGNATSGISQTPSGAFQVTG